MPAEWERHDGTIIAWPHNAADWPGRFAPVPWVVADIAKKLSRRERVHILVNDGAHRTKAESALRKHGADMAAIVFHEHATDRVWTRDSGPIFVKDAAGARAAVDFRFNAWAKYPDHTNDDKLPAHFAKSLKLPTWKPAVPGHPKRRFVLEGGSIEVNGAGLMLTTEECLLHETVQVRNPGCSRTDIEQVFAENLGITKTIWLRNGIAGDDTHGHIDDLARFTSRDTAVIVTEPDPTDANHAPLAENLALLREARDTRGRRLKVATLPMPAPVVFDGQRLPASYANFYVANGIVLVPTFNDPADRVALDTLAGLFPGREVVGVHCLDFILGLGAIHCMTQQIPA